MNIHRFIANNKIKLTAEWSYSNPNMDDSNNMDHWKVILTANVNGSRSQLTTYFSKGYGHHGAEPKADEVLDCLASDASGYENAGSFEDWARDYGYDTDSRKAEKTYNVIGKQAAKLKKFLGADQYEVLLWSCERE